MVSGAGPFLASLGVSPIQEYWYYHEQRCPAILQLEVEQPFRLRYIQLKADLTIKSDSGWHGTHWDDHFTIITPPFTLTRIELSKWRYIGESADWKHDCVFENNHERQHVFQCTNCSCGTVHKARFVQSYPPPPPPPRSPPPPSALPLPLFLPPPPPPIPFFVDGQPDQDSDAESWTAV